MASMATALAPAKRNVVWSIGVGLAVTRIVLLAHWASDVVARLAIGAATERLLRFVSGYSPGRRRVASAGHSWEDRAGGWQHKT